MSTDEPTSAPQPAGTPYQERHLANVAAALKLSQHPKQIGPYRILDVIGEGGMGTVYKAQQETPIERVVAIKVIKLGMDTRAVLERFESERRALSLMEHPNVARVLDAGTTEAGGPYFVMEFVDGSPITTYADTHRLSVRDRLLLMSQACEAVQHAHQKAIIHRDIKPSNILVADRDGVPVVKVIDFGVAKAIDQSAAERTMFTEVGQLVGTPEYMSPEQADGDRDIDTRTDVYSLGVVLYELLSGALPFDSKTLRSAGYGEVCRIIREVDPPRPSAKLASLGKSSTAIANQRQSSPALLAQQLRSELDWIVVKSLRKDRETRYASPHEITQDIENYLANRPLKAGPESLIYRVKKFTRRNKSGVTAAALAVALLLIGTAATSWQAIRATRAERATREEQKQTLAEKGKAQSAQKDAEIANDATGKVNDFLVDMLTSVDPDNAQGKPILVRDVVDRAAADVGLKFKDQPKQEAAVRSALGETYFGLGVYDKAEEHLTAALHLYEKIDGVDARETLRAKQRLANLTESQGNLDDSFKMMGDVLTRAQQLFGPDDKLTVDTESDLAAVAERRGDPAEAERLLREVIASDERTHTADARPYYITLGELGQMLRPLGRLEEAESLMAKAHAGLVRISGPDDPTAIDMLGTYSDVLRLQGKLPEAEKGMREYVERAVRVFGPDHPRSIWPEQGLAVVLEAEGRSDEAVVHFRNALARCRKILGSDHDDTLFQVMVFAAARDKDGDHDEAETLFREAYEGWLRKVGPDHPDTVNTLYGMIDNWMQTEKWDQALAPSKALFTQLQDPARVQISPTRRARYLSAYGIVLAHSGHLDDAVAPLVFAYEALMKQDIHAPGNREAFISTIQALISIADIKGDAGKKAYWESELARAGPIATQPTTQSTTKPTTAAATQASTTPTAAFLPEIGETAVGTIRRRSMTHS